MDINQLTYIFCDIDDFCNELNQHTQGTLLPASQNTSRRGPTCCLHDSEIMTILIFFPSSGYRNFKHFYVGYLSSYWSTIFPRLPSYNRFIEIMKRVIFPLVLFSQLRAGKRTGIYYIDSTCLPVCHLKRSRRHKTFEDIAEYGRTSAGWFFGLKLQQEFLKINLSWNVLKAALLNSMSEFKRLLKKENENVAATKE